MVLVHNLVLLLNKLVFQLQLLRYRWLYILLLPLMREIVEEEEAAIVAAVVAVRFAVDVV